jgi:hypothetical protein
MKRLISTKSIAAVAVALGAFAAASAAQARSDVYFSVGVQSAPGVYVQPAPVYVQPRWSGYEAPRHVYVAPQPAYVPAPAYYGQYRYEHGRRHEWARHRYGPYGDLDRDGILNQYDRDRDGDGIRNRYDRFPDRPYR